MTLRDWQSCKQVFHLFEQLSALKHEDDVSSKQHQVDQPLQDVSPAAGEGDDTHNQSQGQEKQSRILQTEMESSAGEVADDNHRRHRQPNSREHRAEHDIYRALHRLARAA